MMQRNVHHMTASNPSPTGRYHDEAETEPSPALPSNQSTHAAS